MTTSRRRSGRTPALNRVRRLLVSVGVFEERGNGTFALTSLGELLRVGIPGSMRSMVLLFAGVNTQDAGKEREYRVQTAEPPHGRLLIAEGLYPQRIDQSDLGRSAAATDVNMSGKKRLLASS